jgi:hypothetical protein
MTHDEFNELLIARMGKMKHVLSMKAAEYAPGLDRLRNFRVAARYNAETPERALWGMLKKHLASISDLIDALPNNSASMEIWDEKIGNTINYLVLLEALVNERLGV